MWWIKPWSSTQVTFTFNVMEKEMRARIWVPWKRHWLRLPNIGNMLTYDVNMGESLLLLEIYGNLKTLKSILIFWGIKRCDINFQMCEKKHSSIKLVLHLCEITYIKRKRVCLPYIIRGVIKGHLIFEKKRKEKKKESKSNACIQEPAWMWAR